MNVNAPGKMRFFKTSVPIAEAFNRHTFDSSNDA